MTDSTVLIPASPPAIAATLTPVQQAVLMGCHAHVEHSYEAIRPSNVYFRTGRPFNGTKEAIGGHLRALADAGLLHKLDTGGYQLTISGERVGAWLTFGEDPSDD